MFCVIHTGGFEGVYANPNLCRQQLFLYSIASNLTNPTSPTIMAPILCDRCGDALAEGCDPLEELSRLDALFEHLTLKRYILKRKINQYHSPIIRQLPPDVMSTIFELCLPDFADFQFLPSKADLCVPLSLGAICSYWRDIAWSTPSLWSSLVIRVKRSKRNSHVIIAQEWLTRSGQLPLSIRILSSLYEPIPKSSRQEVSALADIINPYSARWSNFDLCMPRCFYQFFRATNNHAPILKSIRFHCSSKYDAENFQLTCPRLERANLSLFRMDGTNIQWDNLTHLNLHNMSIIDSFLILCKTLRLVFCKISYVRLHDGEPSVVILTSLRSLQLITSYFEEFLNNLITPHLEELSLSRHYNLTMEVIASFLKRSACSLHSFSMIFIVSAYFEGFMSLLQLMPSLKTLSITSADLFNAPGEYDPRNILQLVAKVLSSQSTTLQQRLLPNLEVLEYSGKLRLRPGNYANLYPLPPVDNAVRGPFRLLELDLYGATRIPKNIISYFLSLAERGVIVNVLCKSEDILQSSIDYYRDREEFLSRDWVDDLDLSLMQELSFD